MDSDDFDDDIADEDFIQAFDTAASSLGLAPLQNTNSSVLNEKSRDKSLLSGQKSTPDIVLDDLPSDAFSSPEPIPFRAGSGTGISNSTTRGARGPIQRTASGSYKQTTLWGGSVPPDVPAPSQPSLNRVFRADLPREEPSHHDLDLEAMRTWVYPTNLGTIRDYQFSIVKNSLFNNTLVALPTGLGKTFIAATVMLNFYRWTKNAKIVFVAPTKPLASQQVEACYNIVGIPRSDTTLLTGDVAPQLREDEWRDKRVFFMTPQTLQNDLSKGYADPKSIALLVVDEAHRATGEYAYAKVTKFIRRFSKSMRVLALTATPGSKIDTVQEVINNLGISHCEIRTEDSIDIRQYVHSRDIEQRILDPSDEMNLVTELFTKALKPMMDKLSSQNIWYARNPMALTAYGLMQAQKEWFESRGRHTPQGLQHMMRAIFSALTSIAHSIKLLNFHGIKPFYENLKDMRNEQEGKGDKGSKYKRQLVADSNFQEMMNKIELWLRTDGFVGHPKLTELCDCVLNHFMDHNDRTRVIVFSEYRDSAEDIVKTLNTHQPLIKASVFVGQADGKRNEGMKQAQQIATIERFRKGEFNVLVATSIGEEGLDIGQVDLIVCYDSSASPIRMLQRMGRTGRKRAGSIVLLLMRGKEEEQFAKSKDNYEKMQKLICEGSRFDFRFDLSTRIVPREIRPEVDKRHVDIPVENTQDNSLPEPKKRRMATKKTKTTKKFHMPDGVETGFQTVSTLLGVSQKTKRQPAKKDRELDSLASIPRVADVVLKKAEVDDLDRTYRDLPFNNRMVEETNMPDLSAHPEAQRRLQKTVLFKHSTRAKHCIRALYRMSTANLERSCRDVDTSNFPEIPVKDFVESDGERQIEADNLPVASKAKQIPTAKTQAKTQAKNQAKTTSKPKTRVAPKQRAATNFSAAKAFVAVESAGGMNDFDEDEDEDDDNLTEDEKGSGRHLKASKKGKRRGQKQHRGMGGHGINSDEVGDACNRDSDALEDDGSDDGSDLLDFIVSDNHVVSSAPDQYALPTSSVLESPVGPAASKANGSERFFTRTDFPVSQDSDELPDLDTVVGRKRRATVEVVGESENEAPATKKVARGRRQVVESDSDE